MISFFFFVGKKGRKGIKISKCELYPKKKVKLKKWRKINIKMDKYDIRRRIKQTVTFLTPTDATLWRILRRHIGQSFLDRICGYSL